MKGLAVWVEELWFVMFGGFLLPFVRFVCVWRGGGGRIMAGTVAEICMASLLLWGYSLLGNLWLFLVVMVLSLDLCSLCPS